MIERASAIFRSILIAAAAGALAVSLSSPLPAVLALFAMVAPFVPLRIGPRFARVLAVIAYLAIAATGVISWSLMVVLMLHGDSTDATLMLDGMALLSLAILLSLSERKGAAVLSAIFALVVAGLHRNAAIGPYIVVAGAAAIAVLAAEAIGEAPRRVVARPWRRGVAGGAALLFALGIFYVLPPAQIGLERALFSMYSPPASARSGLSRDDVRLGEVESLAMSPRVALHVWSARAQKLRARAYLSFDGRLWHAPTGQTVPPAGTFELAELRAFRGTLLRFPGVNDVSDAMVTRIVPIGLDAGLIPTPGDALAIKTRDQVQVDPFGVVLPTRTGIEVAPYAIVHRRRLGVGDAGPVDLRALTLPRVVDARVRAAAAQIASETQDPRQRITRTILWIQSMAHYDLEVGAFKSRDPIAEFLFDKHRGYCEYFASALALLLRLEGIPTRFVTGYQVDSSSLEGSHYVVRDSDAHAWVEAYLDGVGWVEADATPPGEYASLHQRNKGTAWTRLRAAWADFWIVARHGSFAEGVSRAGVPVLVIVLLGVFAFVVRRALLRREPRAPRGRTVTTRPTVPAVVECVAQIDRAFETHGLPRPRAHGLLEHLSLVERRGLDEHAATTIRQAIDLVHRRHFGAEPVDDDALQRAGVAIHAGNLVRS
jgi:hypothetical protein